MRSAVNAANMRFDGQNGVEMSVGIIGEKGVATRSVAFGHTPPPR